MVWKGFDYKMGHFNLLPLLLSPSLRWNVTFFTRIERGAGAGETLHLWELHFTRWVLAVDWSSGVTHWVVEEYLQGNVLYFTPLARVALKGGNPSKLTFTSRWKRGKFLRMIRTKGKVPGWAGPGCKPLPLSSLLSGTASEKLQVMQFKCWRTWVSGSMCLSKDWLKPTWVRRPRSFKYWTTAIWG